MAIIEQLQLFELDDTEKNTLRIEEVYDRVERVRKGTYANIGEIKKLMLEIKDDLEHMKRAICRGQS